MIFGKNPFLWIFPVGETLVDGLNWESKLKANYSVLINNNKDFGN